MINTLDEESPLAEMFKNLIGGFIDENPIPIIQEVQSEWDKTSTEDRLVFSSPIPLNEEQRKILSAVNNKSGKFITVQGPPGTGKTRFVVNLYYDNIQTKAEG